MTDSKAAELLHLRGQSLAKGDPIAPPITLASMYHLPGTPGGVPGYGRSDQPTWEATEHLLSHLEEAPALLFPSGMGAISAALFATLKAGDRLLVPSDGYYNVRKLADEFLAGFGVEVVERPTTGFAEGGFAGFSVVFIETPSNPGLDLIDLAATCAAVRGAGGLTVVDNTTMTPLGQRPLELGADVVVASDTKAPGGHSDTLMGHVAARDPALMERVRAWRTVAGGIPGPFEAWLLHRSLETLHLRFAAMCASAEAIAPRLAAHPAVTQCRYPGLPEDPSHNLAAAQMATNGFLIGLTLSDEAKAEAFIDSCPFLRPATSFGGVHSSAERRARWGDAVAPGFVRLSVGTEPVEPLWAALREALDGL
ncbi:cystathionine gamma-lyase [Oceanicola sp. 502str15]|uniref:cystathionine gamma-lyase n=1 Tax=Oceanicola sp. 502str15 TaxID=2696061 RepID=UPI0020950F9D|nr:cystathionine gamma-lyase [Oceanicola sp. 502str15]MCO6382158.1 cystathionine gamma-lyase [Oceanicola sp. 502str15]